MRELRKKIPIIIVMVLFSIVNTIPALDVNSTTNQGYNIPIEITSVQENGLLQTESYQLSSIEYKNLIEKLNTLIKLINMVKGEEDASNILLDFINGNDNPIMSKIINAFLNSEINFNRQIVMSVGWGLNFNPFKNSQTDFMKPITFWHYAEKSSTMDFPSITANLAFNPFKIETMIGSQLGIMMRFRGIYIHLPQQYPNQSFTFFMGTAKHIINIELLTSILPDGMMN